MKKTLKILFLISACTSFLTASPLKSDEHLLFLPNIAYIKNKKLYIEINVWVYETEKRPGFNTILSKYLDIKISDLPIAQQEYFKQQTALFKVDSERNKALTIQFSTGETFPLAKTDRSGRSNNLLSFELTALSQLQLKNNLIPFTLKSDAHIQSYAVFSPDEGYLIISDIDDTIKDSSVLDTKTLLRNTFLYPPKTTHDMPDLFHSFKENLNSPLFAYISSSPIQLYPTLHKFIHDYYPKGILKLRHSTAWNGVIATKEESIEHKKSNIIHLLAAFPSKQVILVGDSGENDPEIYLDIYQKYSNRIDHIYIRNVTNEEKHAERYHNFPQTKFSIIAP